MSAIERHRDRIVWNLMVRRWELKIDLNRSAWFSVKFEIQAEIDALSEVIAELERDARVGGGA